MDSGPSGRLGIYLDGLPFPRGAVDDASSVGGEPRGPDIAPAERQPAVGGSRSLRPPPDQVSEQRPRDDRGRGQRSKPQPGDSDGRPTCGRLARSGVRDGRAGEGLQVEREVVRRVEALLGVLLEAVADDPLEARRDVLVRDGEVRRVLLQDRRHRVGGRVAVERALAREHLVEDRAEGEDVAARVGGPPRTCSGDM